MKISLIKVAFLSFSLMMFSSCDVNQFLDDLASTLEEPQDNTGSTNTQQQQQQQTQPERDINRTDERASDLETRTGEASVESIIVELDLSQEQLSKYKQINASYSEKIEAVKKSGKDSNTKSQDMKQLRNDQDREIYNLLTPTQVEKFKQIQAERNSNFKGGR